MARRLAHVDVTLAQFQSVLDSSIHDYYHIPDEATLVDVFAIPGTRTWRLEYEHSSFNMVADGCESPNLKYWQP